MKKKGAVTASTLALMSLGFALGACEYVVVVILPDIAEGLDASLGAVGKLVGVFAAGYAIGTPIVTAATGRVPRFRLLMTLLTLFIIVNAVSMLAPGLWVLYLSRALAAVLTGTLTAVAFLFVQEVAPPEHTAKAISMVYTGMSLATVVGNPLNKTLSSMFGWRAPFAVILLAAVILVPVLTRVLPHSTGVAEGQTGFFRQFTVLRDKRYSLCVLMTIFCYAATYVVYTYLTPILTDVLEVGDAFVSSLLMAVGFCCMGSNLLAGWIGSRGDVERTPIVLVGQTALFLAMPLLGNRWAGMAAVFVMCLLMYVLSTPVQFHASTLAAKEYPFAANLCASTLSVAANIGIAVGSFAGSELQELVGMRQLGLWAAGFALLALVMNGLLVSALRAAPRGGRPGAETLEK